MKHGSKIREARRNRLAAELFAGDAPFKHHVERDRKHDYQRHPKHERRWLEQAISEKTG